MPYGIVQADQLQTSVTGATLGPGNATNFKNRIINGGMVLDQRNAGASVTPATGDYTLDRWQCALTQASKFTVQQNAGSVTPPTGFINYLGVTSSSAYSIISSDIFSIQQKIEGLNVADLAWGTANAQTVTLSFWVRSSLTGTFGGSAENSAANRSYPFTYTISSANTWTQISVTIPGDTTGTWLTTNGVGIRINFGLGVGSTASGTAGSWAAADYRSATGAVSVVGTNAATWYVTGVQLEVGSAATGFEFRDYGRELILCQRYFETLEGGTNVSRVSINWTTNTSPVTYAPFVVTKRTSATISFPTNGSARFVSSSGLYTSQTATTAQTGVSGFTLSLSLTVASASFGWIDNIGTIFVSAEL